MDSESFVGEIGVTAATFAPVNWAVCDGSLLPIRQNSALFAILGTFYGGDGITTFGLPDLRGRVPIGAGQGPGLSNLELGEAAGTETVTLLANQMPQHIHPLMAGSTAETASPVGGGFAPAPTRTFRTAGGGGTFTLATLPVAGGGQPHENLQPYLALTYVIALNGIFPQRP